MALRLLNYFPGPSQLTASKDSDDEDGDKDD